MILTLTQQGNDSVCKRSVVCMGGR